MQLESMIVMGLLVIVLLAIGGEPVWYFLARRASRPQSLGWLSVSLSLLLATAWCCASPCWAQAPSAPETPPAASEDQPPEPERPAGGDRSGPGHPLQVPLESIDDTDTIVLAEDRPDWVEQPPTISGDVHYWSVKSDYHLREHDAWRALDDELVRSAREYVIEFLGSAQAPLFFQFDAAQLKERFVHRGQMYHEIVEASVGRMHQMHARLEFPQEYQEELQARWSQVVSAMRLFRTLGVAAGVLGLIAVLFAYFRLDTATRGYYTLRLKLLAGVAILAVVVLGVAFSRSSLVWIQWLL